MKIQPQFKELIEFFNSLGYKVIVSESNHVYLENNETNSFVDIDLYNGEFGILIDNIVIVEGLDVNQIIKDVKWVLI